MELLLFLFFGLGLMWFLIVLPQRRRDQAHRSMIDELKPGDYVVTAGGMYGTVTDLGDEDLGLEIAPDVEVRVAKKAIGALVPEEEIEDVDVEEDAPAAPPPAQSAEPENAPEDAAPRPPA